MSDFTDYDPYSKSWVPIGSLQVESELLVEYFINPNHLEYVSSKEIRVLIGNDKTNKPNEKINDPDYFDENASPCCNFAIFDCIVDMENKTITCLGYDIWCDGAKSSEKLFSKTYHGLKISSELIDGLKVYTEKLQKQEMNELALLYPPFEVEV